MGVGGQRHAPAALPPVITRYPLYRRLGRPQGRSGRVRKISPPPGFESRTVQPRASKQTQIMSSDLTPWPCQCCTFSLYLAVALYLSMNMAFIAARTHWRLMFVCGPSVRSRHFALRLWSSFSALCSITAWETEFASLRKNVFLLIGSANLEQWIKWTKWIKVDL
jgi:hypothetical protein